MIRVTLFAFLLVAALCPDVRAQQCFNNAHRGPSPQIKFEACEDGQYPLRIDSIKMSNVLFNTNARRTALFTGHQVQLCVSGSLPSDVVPSRLQHSVHGKIALLGAIQLPVDFCDIKTDGCNQAEPPCGAASSSDRKLCVCTQVKVPDIPFDYNDVEVVWKLLDVSNSNPPTGPNDCEKTFSSKELLTQKNKVTLACIKIPAMVKQKPPKVFLDAQNN